jgi:hypothetical protein
MEHSPAYRELTSVLRPKHERALGAGTMLLWIAGLHQAVGFSAGLGLTALPGADTAPLLDVMRHGWFGAVEPQLDRMVVVWFLFFGFALALFGALLRWLEQNGITTPRGFGLALAGLCALGVSLMPVSGFWLALYPAWRLCRPPSAAR